MNSLDRTAHLTVERLALDTPADPRARHGVAKRGGPNHEKSSGKTQKARNGLREGLFWLDALLDSASRARATYDMVELSD